MNQVKVTERVQKQLFELQDLQYRDFQAKLLPTIEKETVIGVRMPVLRKFAKGYGKTSPVVVSKELAEKYSFMKENDILNEEFISKLSDSQKEIANQINRRTEFRVLRTTYKMY